MRDSSRVVVPVFESPPHSRIEYIFEAGLWVGGVVGGDTLVSSGTRGIGQAHEIYADDYAPGVFSDYYGDAEWTFEYSDKTTELETVRDDPYDGPHRPLPVMIRQTTSTFSASGYNTALYIDLVVTHVGSTLISDAWIGWMIDPDIGHPSRRNYWLDDITGHVRRTAPIGVDSIDVSAAWAMDNARDPDSTGRYMGKSATRILGSMYLGGEPLLVDESYNWWVPSTRKDWDWGPQRTPGDTNVIGGRGFELTDKFRYRLLANREIDYAQPYTAVDRTGEGWMPPPVDSVARRYATGFDIRFLHSVGPVTLAPGDSVVLHWVWCLAENPRAHVRNFSEFDPAAPNPFVESLGLEALVGQMAALKQGRQNDFVSVPIAPPRDLRVTDWNDTSSALAWMPKRTKRLTGYQILRSTAPRLNEARLSAWLGREATSFVDAGLDPAQGYAYRIASVGDLTQMGGLVGPVSSSITLLPDLPRAPGGPSIYPYAQTLLIQPNVEDDTDFESYRVYRRESDSAWQWLGEFPRGAAYIDSRVEFATAYEYRLTAVSSLDYESAPSPMESGAVFDFGGPPQILDFTRGDPSSLTDKESAAAAWKRLMPGARYRDVSTGGPLTLSDFNTAGLTIVVSDGRAPLPAHVLPLLDIYSKSQGVVLMSGRDFFNVGPVLDDFVTLDTANVGFKAGIRRAFYPRALLANPTRMNAEFIGAEPVVEQLPAVDVDSMKTNWGINPVLPPVGDAIPFVGYFEVDTSAAEVLYTYVSNDRNSSSNGMPVVVRPTDGFRRIAIFAFPLSYIEEVAARECVLRTLTRIGYGMVRAEVRDMIDYLFRGGGLNDERDADVNRDGRVDVRDVVELAGRGSGARGARR